MVCLLQSCFWCSLVYWGDYRATQRLEILANRLRRSQFPNWSSDHRSRTDIQILQEVGADTVLSSPLKRGSRNMLRELGFSQYCTNICGPQPPNRFTAHQLSGLYNATDPLAEFCDLHCIAGV